MGLVVSGAGGRRRRGGSALGGRGGGGRGGVLLGGLLVLTQRAGLLLELADRASGALAQASQAGATEQQQGGR